MPFLPVTPEQLNGQQPDFIIVTGDAYVDHPSFGTAIISRVLEDENFSAEDCTERSQHVNRAHALRKLRRRIAFEVRSLPAELPPRIECAVTHEEYPLNLACLLDVLEENDYDHKAAAAACLVTSSAFVKLLRRDEELWAKVNAARELRGLYKLKTN